MLRLRVAQGHSVSGSDCPPAPPRHARPRSDCRMCFGAMMQADPGPVAREPRGQPCLEAGHPLPATMQAPGMPACLPSIPSPTYHVLAAALDRGSVFGSTRPISSCRAAHGLGATMPGEQPLQSARPLPVIPFIRSLSAPPLHMRGRDTQAHRHAVAPERRRMRMHIHMHTQTHTHTHSHAGSHAYAYAYACTYTHTHLGHTLGKAASSHPRVGTNRSGLHIARAPRPREPADAQMATVPHGPCQGSRFADGTPSLPSRPRVRHRCPAT